MEQLLPLYMIITIMATVINALMTIETALEGFWNRQGAIIFWPIVVAVLCVKGACITVFKSFKS